MASIFFPFEALLCILAQLPLGSSGFDCPGPITPPHGLSYARIESNFTGRVTQEYAKLRIKLITDSSIQDKPYKELVQEAADFWQKVLSVKPVNGRLFMSRNCETEEKTFYKKLEGSGERKKYCSGSCATVTKCIEIKVPEGHLDGCNYCTKNGTDCTTNEPEPGNGVENADTVLYVTANDTENCEGPTIAYAGACDIEPSLDRPVFALINVCPTNAARHSDDKKAMLRAIKHEMMHALGFASNLFAYFRDEYGTRRWDRDDTGKPKPYQKDVQQGVIKSIPRMWHVRGEPINTIRWFLVTPNVVRQVRIHFNCSELEGAELEDIPRKGSQLSHFEARVFYDDAMKPNMDNGKGLFSRVSFAVLEDSGWYKVDYSQAEGMDFGRNLGCDFCQKSCKFWMDTKRREGKSIEPYCDSPDLAFKRGITCDGPIKLFSGCPLTPLSVKFFNELHDPKSSERSDQLPRKYQHFDRITDVPDFQVPECGSFDGYADCCPIPLENYDITQVLGYDFNCEEVSNAPWEPKFTWKPWEPEFTWKPWEPKFTRKLKPVEEAKDEEGDDTDESSHLGSSLVLVFLFPLLVILL